MTKARDIADFKFENITDTGTEGTKVASGTTAQRGSTAGQWRYNSQTNKFEGRDNNGFKELDTAPTVSSVGLSNITDAQISANYDLAIVGTNFQSGVTVKFIGNDEEINIKTKYPEFLDWKWEELSKITDTVVEFKLHVYKEIQKEVEKVIN